MRKHRETMCLNRKTLQ